MRFMLCICNIFSETNTSPFVLKISEQGNVFGKSSKKKCLFILASLVLKEVIEILEKRKLKPPGHPKNRIE